MADDNLEYIKSFRYHLANAEVELMQAWKLIRDNSIFKGSEGEVAINVLDLRESVKAVDKFIETYETL